ncbi:hypothetical protein NDU88_000768 [Pleurodeles waltl]|uniref:Uncharacterized protein n=1 Tax=Pleurodeles waltl TaxID=8319 RepID=A0AAV7SY32_PLEWA|nr:hypothetical protein NDU88_000768 [Pleurodeles waltl]
MVLCRSGELSQCGSRGEVLEVMPRVALLGAARGGSALPSIDRAVERSSGCQPVLTLVGVSAMQERRVTPLLQVGGVLLMC